MNILEKILEEIKEAFDENIDDIEDSAGIHHFAIDSFTAWYIARKIIRSHMDEVPKCGECSRRKQYMQGYKDGKKDDGWIPVEERLPEEEGWYQCTCSDKEIWNDDIVRDLYYYPGIKEFVDNIRYENNGLKNIEKYVWTKYVTAWQQQPKPYKAKGK